MLTNHLIIAHCALSMESRNLIQMAEYFGAKRGCGRSGGRALSISSNRPLALAPAPAACAAVVVRRHVRAFVAGECNIF